jgi:hypothetical protein
MSISFVLVGSQIRRFKTVIKSLAAIGTREGVHTCSHAADVKRAAHAALLQCCCGVLCLRPSPGAPHQARSCWWRACQKRCVDTCLCVRVCAG